MQVYWWGGTIRPWSRIEVWRPSFGGRWDDRGLRSDPVAVSRNYRMRYRNRCRPWFHLFKKAGRIV
jgi:hypothetical protein